jgi:hypothetical protein
METARQLDTQKQPDHLSPLPFTYTKTDDPAKAGYTHRRVSGIRIDNNPPTIFTNERILDIVKEKHESSEWYYAEYWRKKGTPQEQIAFQVGEQKITLYNFSAEKPVTDDHLQRMSHAMAELSSRFPQVLEKIQWILIDDIGQESGFGDPEKYPLNGNAMNSWRAFKFTPRGMELMPHRIAATTNFEGTFVHEMTHLIQSEFETDWGEHFQWEWCMDHPDDWELRPTPDGSDKKYVNKHTGAMSLHAEFPMQPEECVTEYGSQVKHEDICDSMVAYVYDPKLLEETSEKKFGILAAKDARLPHPDIKTTRIPKEEITLPAVKPETIYYYIQEPTLHTE